MRFTTTIASAAVAGVLGLAGVSVAGAVASGPSTPAPAPVTSTTATNGLGATKTPGAQPGGRAERASRRRHRRHRAAVITAQIIGITPRALVQELRSGKTIAEVATEHGVQPQAVIDALERAATTRIEAAQAAGKITAERAERLKQRVTTVIPRIVERWHPHARAAG
jgi:uncharacterized protein (DUF433 family)